MRFTDQLTSVICQQRHLATRVIIATQEPTLSPRLLDLCNVTIVHRFLSPAWFTVLKGHLAGAAHGGSNCDGALPDLFRHIIGLGTGEALVFSPTAILDVDDNDNNDTDNDNDWPRSRLAFRELRDVCFKMRVRERVTADGGKSILASDVDETLHA